MNSFRLLIKNLIYYWRKNLILALGISISATVITGALIVGDSVEFSLNRIVSDRLGNVSHVVRNNDRFFSGSLAQKLSDKSNIAAASVLMLKGIAVSDGGQDRLNQVNILGVDESFDLIAGTENFYSRLQGNQLILSENAAMRLGVITGDEVLLRITRASLIPLNAPFVSDQNSTISVRMKIIGIAGKDELGGFNLENIQTAPYNAFVSLAKLNDLMDFDDRANLILINAGQDINSEKHVAHTAESLGDPQQHNDIEAGILDNIADLWTLEDASLRVQNSEEVNEIGLTSERVFIDEATSDPLIQLDGFNYPIITYFVNSLSSNSNHTPYSFVSTMAENLLGENEVIINSWLADDLKVGPGDSLKMSYFVVGPLRELMVEEAGFLIKSVVKMEGRFADPDLMPDLPGLSDAGNCRDWETGVPIELDSIREKDEQYWEQWKGTPKAFISIKTATDLWQNRYGTYTSLRYSSVSTNSEKLESDVLSQITPTDVGFKAESLRKNAEKAAGEGVDFSELFAGLSFFLLAGGILLGVLLFLLNLEFRKEQIHTMSSLGISKKTILGIMFAEGIIIAFAGAVLGLFLAILYNQAVFNALNGIWNDIVRTEMLVVHIKNSSLVKGFLFSMVISVFSILIPLNGYLKRIIRKFKSVSVSGRIQNKKYYIPVFVITGIVAIGLILREIVNSETQNAGIFFISGGLLLVSLISFFAYYLIYTAEKSSLSFNTSKLSMKNAVRNPGRSLTIVILFALASFIVISTGSNRKDLFVKSNHPSGGTGGFLYYAESTVPVLHRLDNRDKRFEFGLSEDYSFVQFRKSEGDDASCLNLNRIQSPVIISCDPQELEDRFSFVSTTEFMDEENPWGTLNMKLPGGLIPAIADETVIKWGMGKKTGDTISYKNSMGETMNLLLVGGLAPSVFQGKVIISNQNFLENFPSNRGTSIFLVEGNNEESEKILNEINSGFRDYGMDVTLSATRLAEFNSVTNTYLSIFLVLGAFGLLLGTIGLGIVLFRSILERKNEIAVMRAVGFSKKLIRKIVIREYYFLLISGIGIGFITAIIATLPSILSPNTDFSKMTLLIIFEGLLFSGWIWIWIMTTLALKNKLIYSALRND